MARWVTRTALSASLVTSALLAGCSGTASDTNLGATETAAITTPATAVGAVRAPLVAAANAHGKAKRVADALGQVALRADQRAQIEALATQAEGRHATAIAAQHDFVTALAAQVATGTLDRAALTPKTAALSAAWSAAQPQERAAFESIHAILDPAQRAEFVDAMTNLPREGHGGDGHGWGKHEGHGPGQHWADELQLTEAQRTTFEQILHDSFAEAHGDHPHAMHGAGHGRAVLDAFKADTFSFDAVAPAEDVGARTQKMTTHLLDIVEKVLPMLTPEQRALAAEKLREHGDNLPIAP